MSLIDKPQKPNSQAFFSNIKVNTESSNNVLSVKELEIGYNQTSLSKVSFELYKGDKVAVIGENGIGKSTLIKTLMGITPKISGKFTYGYNVEKSYFDQQIELINEENTIYEEYEQTFKNESPLQIRKSLGAFQFTGEDVFKKTKVLSGGEKVRLALCKILKNNSNLLLLDEPTNHLDIIGKENLEDILISYPGTILFVSHDRYFINKIATSLLIFEKNKVIHFNGKYQEYIDLKNKESKQNIEKKQQKKSINKVIEPKNSQLTIKKIEKEIYIKEQQKQEIETLMLDEENYSNYQN
jgi:ATP-binding cassette subfamily F protein 3